MTGRRWSEAMRDALYGPDGFYRSQVPAAHFATSSRHPRFADALSILIGRVDVALGCPDPLTVVDVGAGSGELLGMLLDRDVTGRLAPIAVDVRPRPSGLDSRIAWRGRPPESVTGVVLACELLDVVPCDLVERVDGVDRYRLVDESGAVAPGPRVSIEDAAWLDRWWPLRSDGDTAVVGAARDAVWRDLVARLDRGLALAIDYGHVRGDRPPAVVTAYARGRAVAPIPDGTRDLTVSVAMDSLDAAPPVPQRDALRALGVDAARPGRDLAVRDPAAYLRALARASSTADLLDPSGLGAHLWTWASVGIDIDPLWTDVGGLPEAPDVPR